MSLTMTESAAKELKKHKETVQAAQDMFLRVKLVAGGCSGHEHRLFLDSTYDEEKDTQARFLRRVDGRR